MSETVWNIYAIIGIVCCAYGWCKIFYQIFLRLRKADQKTVEALKLIVLIISLIIAIYATFSN